MIDDLMILMVLLATSCKVFDRTFPYNGRTKSQCCTKWDSAQTSVASTDEAQLKQSDGSNFGTPLVLYVKLRKIPPMAQSIQLRTWLVLETETMPKWPGTGLVLDGLTVTPEKSRHCIVSNHSKAAAGSWSQRWQYCSFNMIGLRLARARCGHYHYPLVI